MGAWTPRRGQRERPGLFVCSNIASFFIHPLTLPRDPKSVEDIPSHGVQDRAADALRYRLTFDDQERRRRAQRRWRQDYPPAGAGAGRCPLPTLTTPWRATPQAVALPNAKILSDSIPRPATPRLTK